MATLAGLLAAFTLKHALADFVLQTTWMARGKEARAGWVAPLLAHATVHAGMTLAIALAVAPGAWWLSLVDLVVHATLDRAKAFVTLRVRWCPDQPQFWWLLGVDQALHQLTHIALALALVLV